MNNLTFVALVILWLILFAYLMLQILEVENRVKQCETIYRDYAREKELRLIAESKLQALAESLNPMPGVTRMRGEHLAKIPTTEIVWMDEDDDEAKGIQWQ
jgi:hypothetical protein